MRERHDRGSTGSLIQIHRLWARKNRINRGRVRSQMVAMAATMTMRVSEIAGVPRMSKDRFRVDRVTTRVGEGGAGSDGLVIEIVDSMSAHLCPSWIRPPTN